MLQPLEPVQRLGGLDRDAVDLARVLVEPARGAHHRAARAEAGDEVRDPIAERVEDLDRGAVVVGQRDSRGSSTGRGRSTCPGSRATISRTSRIAPSEPSIGSLKMSSVPKAWVMSLRALVTFFGITSWTR